LICREKAQNAHERPALRCWDHKNSAFAHDSAGSALAGFGSGDRPPPPPESGVERCRKTRNRRRIPACRDLCPAAVRPFMPYRHAKRIAYKRELSRGKCGFLQCVGDAGGKGRAGPDTSGPTAARTECAPYPPSLTHHGFLAKSQPWTAGASLCRIETRFPGQKTRLGSTLGGCARFPAKAELAVPRSTTLRVHRAQPMCQQVLEMAPQERRPTFPDSAGRRSCGAKPCTLLNPQKTSKNQKNLRKCETGPKSPADSPQTRKS
jgi:hypothetical protein